jgi:hypothetical protein
MAKVHAYIIGHLKKEMPSMFGKEKKQNELIENLDQEFLKLHKTYQLPIGDFPDLEKFKAVLKMYNFTDFKKLEIKLITAMDDVLSVDLPKLMKNFPQGNPSLPTHERNPFADYIEETGVDGPGKDPWQWDSVEKSKYSIHFQDLSPVDGKLSGSVVKPVLMESELPVAELGLIWGLADLTKDGYLDVDEFSLAMHLVKLRKLGVELPKMLPQTLNPLRGKV